MHNPFIQPRGTVVAPCTNQSNLQPLSYSPQFPKH
uniref:Uncharacterized protein n=1 Tax=Anguilla anguilla TaxID=7936 RepID=A0A0E9RBN4_ANGAN